MAESKEEVKNLLMKVKEENQKVATTTPDQEIANSGLPQYTAAQK